MAIELAKRGKKIDLTKGNSSLKRINVALGWKQSRYDGQAEADLDVSVFMVDANGSVRDDQDLVFYGNLAHESGGVVHSGDERTGSKDGDDEVIQVDFDRVPAHVEKLVFIITIHDADQHRQNFGQIEKSYARVDNADTGEALIQFDLGEDFSDETAIAVCEIYRYNAEWKFNPVGQGYKAGLAKFVEDYGLQVK